MNLAAMIGLAAVGLPAACEAAAVTWGFWTAVSNNTAIQTPVGYTTYGGVNFNGSTTTINNGTMDVTFTGIAQNASGSAAGITVGSSGFAFQSTLSGNSNVVSAVGSPQTWATVLDRVIGDNDNSATITLSGLTTGRNYYVQFLSSAPDANILADSKIASGGVDSPLFGNHFSGGTRYIIASFTADGTSQSFALTGTEPTYSALVIGVQPAGGGDTTPPAWTATWPQAVPVSDTSLTVRAKINEAGNTYYIVLSDGDPAPSAAQVKAGKDSTNAPAPKSGSLAMTGDTEATASVTGLSPGTAYDIWFVAQDGVGTPNLQSSPNKVDVTTLAPQDTTPPAWTATWPKVNQLSPTSLLVRACANETGTGYYVVLANGAAAPSAAQVRVGTDGASAPALKSGSLALTSNTEVTAPVTGLVTDATYHVWFVAEDAASNLQTAPSGVNIALASMAREPFISEFIAVGGTLQDEDLATADWIEIHNPNGEAIDLGGYYLTDDAANLTKWTIPPTIMPAGGYLVVFASDKNRAASGSQLHTNFKLSPSGEFLGLVKPDGTTVVSSYLPKFPPQIDGSSYGIDGLASTGSQGFFLMPTPGAINGVPGTPLVPPVLDPPGAMFTTSTAVTMTPGIAFTGSVIRYTTDGSEPTAASALYPGSAITITSTTHLRARVFATGSGAAGAIAGGHYQKLSQISDLAGISPPSTFDSNLPLMVVENFGAGAIPNDDFTTQTARLMVFDPAAGRTSLTASPDACIRIGIRKRGASSANFPKAQYRLELRDEAGGDLDLPLLGLPAESDWVLHGPYVDKALIRNSLVFDLGKEIGIKAPRVRHFEMFLNTDGGALTASDYVGVYLLVEKIKQGSDRVDVQELGASDNSLPELTGGYVTRFEPVDTHAAGAPVASGWTTMEIVEPAVPTTAQKNYIGKFFDDFAATLGWARGGGANNNGIVNNNPVTGYPAYIDVASFVNLMTINELVRDQDSYVRSDYMYKDRGGKLFKGPLWDYDLSMGTGRFYNNLSKEGWQLYGSTANLTPSGSYNRGGEDNYYEPDWFVPLLRDADFRQQWIDRWFETRRYGPLANTALIARINSHANPLAEAAARNFIKWPYLNVSKAPGSVFDSPVTTTWTGQIDFIKNWLTTRMTWIDGQFPNLVSFSRASGSISPGTGIALSAPAGTIYYTTDGTDPRLPGGGVRPAASMIASGGTIPVTASKTVIARTLRSTWTMTSGGAPLGVTWAAPTRVTFVVGTPASTSNLLVTEVNHHPASPATTAELADPTFRDDDFEFIEVKNISDGPVDLSGIAFIDGIEHYVLPNQVLGAGEYGVFVENLQAFRARYGNHPQVLGVYSDKLNNGGEAVRLVDCAGATISSFTFSDTWFPTTDGGGDTLAAVNDSTPGADLSNPLSWRASGHPLGTPGMANQSISFAGWLRENFTAAELADPLVSGELADGDSDGIAPLLECALGLDPKLHNDSSNLPTGGMIEWAGDHHMTLSCRRLRQGSDLKYSAEVSADLITWAKATAEVGSPADNGDGTETFIIRDPEKANDAPRRFMRLKVER